MPFNFPQAIQLALTLFLSLILWFPFSIIWGLNEILRAFVAICLLFTDYRLVNGSDGFFTCDNGFHTNIVLTLIITTGEADVEEERKLWRERVFERREPNGKETYSKLKKRLCTKFGFSCWKRESQFEVANNVFIPKGCDQPITIQEIKSQLLPSLSTPFDKTNVAPQWQWLVIPKLVDSDGKMKSGRIFRYHHAYMDGVHLGLLLGECLFDFSKQGRPPFIIDPKTHIRANGRFRGGQLFTFLMLPLIIFKGIFFADGRRSKGNFIAPISNGTRNFETSSQTIELSQLNLHGQKISSLILSTFAVVLARILKDRGEDSSNFILRLNDTQAFPPILDSRPKNQFSVAAVEIKASDPEMMSPIINRSPDSCLLFAYFYIWWTGRLPTFLRSNMPHAAHSSMTFSNVPFLKEEGMIGNTKVEGMFGWTIIVKPMGMGVTVLTYGGKIALSLVTENSCLTVEETKFLMSEVESRLRHKSIEN